MCLLTDSIPSFRALQKHADSAPSELSENKNNNKKKTQGNPKRNVTHERAISSKGKHEQ